MHAGSLLRALRVGRCPRLSMDQVAASLGVSGRTVIHKWETGENQIPAVQIGPWLDLLDATPATRRAVWLAYGLPAEDLAVHGAAEGAA